MKEDPRINQPTPVDRCPDGREMWIPKSRSVSPAQVGDCIQLLLRQRVWYGELLKHLEGGADVFVTRGVF